MKKAMRFSVTGAIIAMIVALFLSAPMIPNAKSADIKAKEEKVETTKESTKKTKAKKLKKDYLKDKRRMQKKKTKSPAGGVMLETFRPRIQRFNSTTTWGKCTGRRAYVSASAQRGFRYVEIKFRGTRAFREDNPPGVSYSKTVSLSLPAGCSGGTHEMEAIVEDKAGNEARKTCEINIDLEPPKLIRLDVRIEKPLHGGRRLTPSGVTIGDTSGVTETRGIGDPATLIPVTLDVEVTDALSGLKDFDVTVYKMPGRHTKKYGRYTRSPITIPFGLTAGKYLVRVRAWDNVDNVLSKEKKFTVEAP